MLPPLPSFQPGRPGREEWGPGTHHSLEIFSVSPKTLTHLVSFPHLCCKCQIEKSSRGPAPRTQAMHCAQRKKMEVPLPGALSPPVSQAWPANCQEKKLLSSSSQPGHQPKRSQHFLCRELDAERCPRGERLPRSHYHSQISPGGLLG